MHTLVELIVANNSMKTKNVTNVVMVVMLRSFSFDLKAVNAYVVEQTSERDNQAPIDSNIAIYIIDIHNRYLQ
jgi:hypothetical protein